MGDLVDNVRGAIDGAETEWLESQEPAATEEAGGELEDQAADDLDEDPDEDSGGSEDQEVEDTEGDDEPEDTGFDWDRVDELPVEKLPPKIAKLRSDRDRLASELGEMRKQLAEFQEQEPAAAEQAEAQEGPPEIYDDDDAETIREKIKAIAAYEAREAIRSTEDKLQTIEDREQRAHTERAQQYMMDQAARIEKSTGYDENVGEMMSALVGQYPGWRESLGSPQGWDQLFDYARHLVTSQSKKAETVTRKATAKQREVPRRTPAPKNVDIDIEVEEKPENVFGKVGSIIDSFKG